MSRSTEDKQTRLAAVPLFAGADRKAMRNLVEAVEEVTVSGGTTLINQGGFPAEFSVIVTGSARVEVNGTDVATLGPDDVIGELAFLARTAASATVTATSDCELLVIRYGRLEKILDGDPGFVRQLTEALARRLLATNEMLS
ncbi:MAG: cyclic nucleotide-binding domain-containing protein [Actinomycetota bacterium]